MEAYKSGAAALKKTLADNGLTPESVDETMSEVQEVSSWKQSFCL